MIGIFVKFCIDFKVFMSFDFKIRHKKDALFKVRLLLEID